jgi:uncharacterized protein YndB with AHSA1/START domain
MGQSFEQHRHAEIPVSPEEAWEAIATGPGIDSWFMGRNEVRPGPGGTVRTIFGEYEPELSVTGWDPPRRFSYRSGDFPDGRFIAYEFLIEGRASASTVVRVVTSGFLPGDDWEDEYDAMTQGSDLYFATLVEYLTHFGGRSATPVTAFGPPHAGWDRGRVLLCRELGLSGAGEPGERARLISGDGAAIDAVVYFSNANTLGLRSSDALYRFLRGFGKPVVAAHHLFAPGTDPGEAGRAWETWLGRLLTEAADDTQTRREP